MKNNLNILYEDNHIIVVIKPYNILSQSDNTNDLDMLTILKKYIKEKYNCRILLADEAAHLVKEPGQPCYEKLVKLLSREILNGDGSINKQKMAEKIFASEDILSKVNRKIR